MTKCQPAEWAKQAIFQSGVPVLNGLLKHRMGGLDKDKSLPETMAMHENLYSDGLSNAIRISSYDQFQGQTSFHNIAAKFVLKGKETYVVGNRKFVVNQGEYLLGNNERFSEVHISETTIGLCVDISNGIITEVLNAMFDNTDLNEFILTDKFLINTYKAQHTTLGHKLSMLSKTLIDGDPENLLRTELFYGIGENIAIDQALVFEQFSRLNYKRQEVQEDVFRSLLRAKHHIEDCFLEDLKISDLVDVAYMSKYAFIRLFKSTFGITPYQFVLQKRLLHARTLLSQGSLVQDVAVIVGFADTPAFSKAFRQYFGYAPSFAKK